MAAAQKTLDLLDELEKLGFTDEAFGRLHHHRVTRNRLDTISAHRRYLTERRIGELRPGDTNERVQRRLELVLGAYRGGGFSNGGPVFVALAEAAVQELPLP